MCMCSRQNLFFIRRERVNIFVFNNNKFKFYRHGKKGARTSIQINEYRYSFLILDFTINVMTTLCYHHISSSKYQIRVKAVITHSMSSKIILCSQNNLSVEESNSRLR
jgi:hypothetical protein